MIFHYFMRNLLKSIRELYRSKKYGPVIDVLLFIAITFIIHFVYRYWAIEKDHRIFGFQVITPAIFDWFSQMVFVHSGWVIKVIMPVDMIDRTFYFANHTGMSINWSCSGIKQILQFAFLLLLFPGPWKHKAWFIPLGVLIIHLTNVFRIIGLAVVMNNWPEHWQFAHHYPFRFIFYVVIFILWVIWNEKFNRGKSGKSNQ